MTLVLIFVFKSFLPPEVPLFFGAAAGEAQLTSSLGLLLAPGISIAVLAVNLAISTLTANIFVKKILIIAAFTAALLAAITVAKIVFLVGFF